jgi:hypothetical protein
MTDFKNFDALSEEEKDQVMKAVDVLCTEKNIGDKLAKLADIKTTKPILWKMVLAKL